MIANGFHDYLTPDDVDAAYAACPGALDELALYSLIEPWGSRGADERLRYLVATLSNTVGGGRHTSSDPKAKPVPWQPSDFPIRLLPETGRRGVSIVRRMDVEESNRHVEGVFAMVGLRFTETWQPPEG